MFRLTMMVAVLTAPAMGVCTAEGATVLLHDSFDGPDDITNLTDPPHDIHLNSNLTARQAGSSLAAVAYRLDVGGGTSYTNPHISSNALVLEAGITGGGSSRSQIIAPDHDFNDSAIVSSGGFVIELAVNPTGGNTGAQWFAVTLGHTSSSVATATRDSTDALDPAADFGLLFRGNGSLNVLRKGTSWSAGSYASGHAPSDFFDIRIEVETDSFASGASATVSAYVNDTQLDVGTSPGDEFTFSWDADESNYISLESRVFPSVLDELTISTIPEPSTLVLLGMAALGLLVYAWRRLGARILRPYSN